MQSMGDRETSGPAPSRGSVAKHTGEVKRCIFKKKFVLMDCSMDVGMQEHPDPVL